MSVRKAPQRRMARHLYFTTTHTQRDIARIIGITEKTLYSWIKRESWAQQKQATYYSPEQELQQLYEELRSINAIINLRSGADRIPTKEELEKRTKILALISGHLKNTGANWRNIAPEYDYEPSAEVAAGEQGEHVETVEELKKRIGEEDFNNKYGKRFSPEKLDEYYNKVARMLVLADSTKKKYDADGNYIANDGRGPKIPPRRLDKKEE